MTIPVAKEQAKSMAIGIAQTLFKQSPLQASRSLATTRELPVWRTVSVLRVRKATTALWDHLEGVTMFVFPPTTPLDREGQADYLIDLLAPSRSIAVESVCILHTDQ